MSVVTSVDLEEDVIFNEIHECIIYMGNKVSLLSTFLATETLVIVNILQRYTMETKTFHVMGITYLSLLTRSTSKS